MKKASGIQKKQLLAMCGIVLTVTLLLTSVAGATLTGIRTSREPSLATYGGILDNLYGLDNLTRVQDSSTAKPTDQYWTMTGDSATVTGRAKYAGFPLQFGILPGESGWDYDVSISTQPNKMGIYNETRGMPIKPVTRNIDGSKLSDTFRFGLRIPRKKGYIWSSVPTDNAVMPGGFRGDRTDHMVTWQITDNTGYENNQIGNYVVAWEDLATDGSMGWCSDRDYNDLVVEVAGVKPVPEPASICLFTLMGIFVYRFQRKH